MDEGVSGRAVAAPGSWVALADGFLCVLVGAVACALYLSAFGGRFALNADIVMPYVLYEDAAAGWDALSGWILPEAPYWFPDLLATWAIYAATSLPTAVNVYAVLQTGAYLALARWVLCLVSPSSGRLAWRIFLLLWIAFVLVGLRASDSWFDRFGHYVFVPYTHGGALVATLATLGLLLAWQRKPDSRAYPATLVLLGTLMLLSDRLYVISAMLPALAVAATPVPHRRVRIGVSSGVLALLAGSEACRWLAGESATGSRYGAVNTPAGALFQMTQDFATALLSSGAATVLVLAGAIALVRASATAWRRRREFAIDADAGAAASAWVFVALSIALPMAASVVLGRHTAMDSFRYCQTLCFLLLPLSHALASSVPRRFGRMDAVMAGVVAATAGAAAAFGDTSQSALKTEWRAHSECLDEAQARYGLHNGLSLYWRANALNAQLRSGSRLFAVMGDLESTPINKNMDWIGARAKSATELPVLDFVDEFQFEAAILDEALGAPLAVVTCPLSPIRIYAPDAGLLARLYGRNGWLPQESLARFGRMAVPAAAWLQAPAVREADGLRVSGRFGREIPVLVGAVESGDVRHWWIDYRLSGSYAAARWEAVALDRDGGVLHELASGVLEGGAARSRASLALPRPPEGAHGVGVSVFVRGQVDLWIGAVGMARD